MSAAERRARAVISRLPDGPVVGAEIGVFDGRMSEQLLRMRKDLSLIMVDLWGPASEQYAATGDGRAMLTAAAHREAYCKAMNRTLGMRSRRRCRPIASRQAAANTAPHSLDFAFIDADHSEAGVTEDIAAWTPAVKPGGLLCGHDYGHKSFPGVKRAVDAAVEANGWPLDLGDDRTWFVRL